MSITNITEEPSIVTKRLKLSPWSENLAEAFFDLTQNDGFNSYPITVYRQESIESARDWIRESSALQKQTGLGKLTIQEKENGTLIGMGGLTPWSLGDESLVDLTYRLRQSAFGRGYGTESALAIVKYGFEVVGLEKITATITPDNLPSIKIAYKLGMRLDRRIVLKGGETLLFRLLPKDFVKGSIE